MFHVKHSTTTTSCTRKQNQHKTSKTMGFAAFRKRKILALPTAYLCASAVQCFAQCKNTRSSLSAARFIGILPEMPVRRETCPIYNNVENNAKNVRKQRPKRPKTAVRSSRKRRQNMRVKPLLFTPETREFCMDPLPVCDRNPRPLYPSADGRTRRFSVGGIKIFHLQKVCFRNRLYIIN